jgi:hypothetical protein
MLRRAIVLVPHHPLHLTRGRVIQGSIGRRRMPQTMHHNPGILGLGKQQCFRDDPLNAPRPQRRPALTRAIPSAFTGAVIAKSGALGGSARCKM